MEFDPQIEGRIRGAWEELCALSAIGAFAVPEEVRTEDRLRHVFFAAVRPLLTGAPADPGAPNGDGQRGGILTVPPAPHRVTKHEEDVLTDYPDVLLYARYLADEMGLADWNVELSEEPCAESSRASCHVWQNYRGINLYLSAGWQEGYEAEDMRSDLLHELTHCYTLPPFRVWQAAEKLIGGPAWDVLSAAANGPMETATDGMSSALEPFLELPGNHPVPQGLTPYRYTASGHGWWHLDRDSAG